MTHLAIFKHSLSPTPSLPKSLPSFLVARIALGLLANTRVTLFQLSQKAIQNKLRFLQQAAHLTLASSNQPQLKLEMFHEVPKYMNSHLKVKPSENSM
jgi:hypothetical protein